MKLKFDACAIIECEKLSILPIISQIYEDLIITGEVYQEAVVKGLTLKKPQAEKIQQDLKSKKISTITAHSTLKISLGPGEAETISEVFWEKTHGEDVAFVTGDKKALNAAIEEKIDIRSIEILLVEACLQNIISEDEFDQKIREYDGFHKLSLIRISELKQFIKIMKSSKNVKGEKNDFN